MADVTIRFTGDPRQAISATRDVQRTLRGLEGQVEKTRRASSGMLSGITRRAVGGATAALGTAGLGAALTGTIRLAADFERQLNVLGAVSNATGRQMQAAGALAKTLGRDITLPATSAKDAATAMTELVKGGLNVSEAMLAAKGTLQLAAAANVDAGTAAIVSARALSTFGLAGSEAGHVADLLANAANASTGEISDMAMALSQAGQVARGAGLSIDETVAAISVLAQDAQIGSDAGTSLRTTLQRLAGSSDEARDMMTKLGIDAFDAQEKLLPLSGIITEFGDVMARMTPKALSHFLNTVFGADSARAALTLFGKDGAKAYAAMTEEVTKQGGAARVAGARMKGFSGAMEAFRSAVETLSISLGQTLLPILTPLIRRMAAWVSQQEQSGSLARRMAATTDTVAAAVRGLSETLRTAHARISGVADAMGGWGDAFKLILSGFLATKVVGVAAALGRVGTAATISGGKVGVLRTALLGLRNFGAVTLGIELLVNKDEVAKFGEWLNARTPGGFDWNKGIWQNVKGAVGGAVGDRGPAPGTSAAFGSATIAAGADRPGVATKQGVQNFVSRIAGVSKRPLTITTGTRHKQFARGGNQSQHWTGDAADIPAEGDDLTMLGKAALIAAGMDPAEAMKAPGGIYNLNGAQVIFNTTDHFDHLHIGIAPGGALDKKLAAMRARMTTVQARQTTEQGQQLALKQRGARGRASTRKDPPRRPAPARVAAPVSDRTDGSLIGVGALRPAPKGRKATTLRALAADAARAAGIPEELFNALIYQESKFDPKARSPAGAMGLGQLMPGTARGLGVKDAFDPKQNLRGAAEYLRQMLVQFKGDVRLALAAYNAGPGAVQRAGGDLSRLPGETQRYVPSVLRYEKYGIPKGAGGGGDRPGFPDLRFEPEKKDVADPKDRKSVAGSLAFTINHIDRVLNPRLRASILRAAKAAREALAGVVTQEDLEGVGKRAERVSERFERAAQLTPGIRDTRKTLDWHIKHIDRVLSPSLRASLTKAAVTARRALGGVMSAQDLQAVTARTARLSERFKAAVDLTPAIRDLRGKAASLVKQVAKMPDDARRGAASKLAALRRALGDVVSPKEIERIRGQMGRVATMIARAIDRAKQVVAQRKEAVGEAFGNLMERALRVFDARTEQLLANARAFVKEFGFEISAGGETPAERELRGLDASERLLDNAERRAEAEKELAEAQEERRKIVNGLGDSELELQRIMRDAAADLEKTKTELRFRFGEDAELTPDWINAQRDYEQAVTEAERAAAAARIEELRRADERITQAERGMNRLTVAERREALEERARVERDAADAALAAEQARIGEQRAIERDMFEQQYQAILAAWQRGEIGAAEAQERLLLLLDGYGAGYANAGALLGDSFASAFIGAINKTKSAINDLREAMNVAPLADESLGLGGRIGDTMAQQRAAAAPGPPARIRFPRGLAKGGVTLEPQYAMLSETWRQGRPAREAVWPLDDSRASGAIAGAIAPAVAELLGQGAGAAAPTVVENHYHEHINVGGSVVSERDLLALVRRQGSRHARRNGSVGLA